MRANSLASIVVILLLSACALGPPAGPLVSPLSVVPSPTRVSVVPTPLPPMVRTRAPTPTATFTPLPTRTATPIPTILPPVQPATLEKLPSITHSLAFLGRGSMMLWNHITGKIEVLAAPDLATRVDGALKGVVITFSASADGRKIALVRTGDKDYELAVLDVSSRRITKLVTLKGPPNLGMSISPDGKWVAYIPPGTLPSIGRTAGLAAPAARPSAGGSQFGVIYAVRTDTPDKPIEVGFCSEETTEIFHWTCMGLLWSRDSQTITWSDARGIWVTALAQPARVAAFLTPPPPTRMRGILSHQAWSPLGRYLLGWENAYEGGSRVVVDTQTGRIADLPDSFQYVNPGPSVTWMRDGRLAVLRPGKEIEHQPPTFEIWHVEPQTPSLIRDSVVPLQSIEPDNLPIGIIQLADGRLAFGLSNSNEFDNAGRGLYWLRPGEAQVHKVNGLLPAAPERALVVQVIWSPDGTGAIARDLDTSRLLYIPADGSTPSDITPVLGQEARYLTWLGN